MWLINGVQSLSQLCSTTILRSTNVALTIICSILVHDLLVHLRPSIGERRASFYAILISLYPVHWFFTFLYYTDIASLAAVLAMYLASLKKRFWVSAIVSILSLCTFANHNIGTQTLNFSLKVGFSTFLHFAFISLALLSHDATMSLLDPFVINNHFNPSS